MWPWFGRNPWGWPAYRMPYSYFYGGYGYSWGAIPKEEEIRMLEEQERWLTSELNIEDYCHKSDIEVAVKIPFDNVVTEAIVEGLPVVEYSDGKVTQQVRELWQIVSAKLNN